MVFLLRWPLNHLLKYSLCFPYIDSCVKYGIPAMCYHIFPTCDSEDKDSKPRLCREDCDALYDNVCEQELKYASMDPLYNNILPDCSILPSRGDKDYSYCSPLHIPGKLKAVCSSVQANFLQKFLCGVGEAKKKFFGYFCDCVHSWAKGQS